MESVKQLWSLKRTSEVNVYFQNALKKCKSSSYSINLLYFDIKKLKHSIYSNNYQKFSPKLPELRSG